MNKRITAFFQKLSEHGVLQVEGERVDFDACPENMDKPEEIVLEFWGFDKLDGHIRAKHMSAAKIEGNHLIVESDECDENFLNVASLKEVEL